MSDHLAEAERARTDVAVRLVEPAEYDEVGLLAEAAYSHDYAISEHYRASLLDVATRATEHEVWVAVDLAGEQPDGQPSGQASDVARGRLLGTVATPRPGGHLSELARDGEFAFRLLAVAPAARRRGIGRLLVEHVLTLGRVRGAHRVVMNSGPQMTGAHRLYLDLGFRRLPERETKVVEGRTLYAFGLDISPETEVGSVG